MTNQSASAADLAGSTRALANESAGDPLFSVLATVVAVVPASFAVVHASPRRGSRRR